MYERRLLMRMFFLLLQGQRFGVLSTRIGHFVAKVIVNPRWIYSPKNYFLTQI